MNRKQTNPRWIAAMSAVLLAAACWPGNGVAAEELNPIGIEEWAVPYGGRARDPFAAGADEIWFVGQRGHYLGRFTPSTGAFFKRDLNDAAGPHNLLVQGNGIVWYSGNLTGYIGRYDPRTDRITRITMPDPGARDPHTLAFDAGERHIWFTAQGGNFIGRLALADHSVDLMRVPTRGALPYGIRLAADGTPWVALFGTNKLARVDPVTLALTEVEIPAPGARPRRLEITSDGRVWFGDYARGYLGVYDPVSKQFAEWALPAGAASRPYGMAVDSADRVWVVETGVSPNRFVGFDTKAERVVSVTEIPSGAGSVRHMDYHAPSGSVWFGTDKDTLGRARVGDR